MLDIFLIFFTALLLFLIFSFLNMKTFMFRNSNIQKENNYEVFKQFQDVKTEVLEKEIRKLSKQLSALLITLFFLILVVLILSNIL